MTSLPRFSVKNPVLVNLFMVTILAGGAYSGATIVREMFPESRPNRVMVLTAYPGASPSEVEKGITLRIEETVKDVDGVEKLTSSASEGVSTIIIELESSYHDIDQAVTDVKAAIDTIPTEDFPTEAEQTAVSKLDPKLPVISIALFGELDSRRLKTLGEDLREEVMLLPGISNVVLSGTRRDEISIEVRPERLVRYGLSFMDVAGAIAESNLDVPGGQLRTSGSNVSVRTLGEKDRGEELYDIVLRSDPTGRVVRLADVATIVDGFEDIDVLGRFNGAPAVNITVYKTPEQDAIGIAKTVRAMVAGKQGTQLHREWTDILLARVTGRDTLTGVYEDARRNPFPPGVNVDVHTDLSRFVEGRLDLLTRNGLWGLLLVALSLLVFLHWRVAFWVMMGLVLAVMGALLCMQFLGHTLNLITMFGLIIVLGLLVDDAIIVSEHVFTKWEAGVEPHQAAIDGTEEVTWPVVAAILTTVVAFLPLMFIEGQLGSWLGTLPVIVCIALTVSLIEALTILPSHLAHGLKPTGPPVKPRGRSALRDVIARIRRVEQDFVQRRLRRTYTRLLTTTTQYRYVTIAGLMSVLIVVFGLLGGGFVQQVFIQKVDSETLVARLRMEVGTPVAQTATAVEAIEKAAMDLPELRSVYSLIGIEVSDDAIVSPPQSHLAQVFIELTPSEQRRRNSDKILADLRAATDAIEGVEKLNYTSLQGGPGGAPVHLEIGGDDVAELSEVADEIKSMLADYEGVFDVLDDFEAGRREVQIELFYSARALGLTTASLATQVRAAFYGFEARKVQRGREDVKIMVRYPAESRRRIYDIETMRIATPSGALVPFTEVARLAEGTGFSTIHRKNQRRTVTVTADVDDAVVTPDEIIASLMERFPSIYKRHPGVKLEFGGQKLETKKAFGSIKSIAVIAVLLIYVILAGLFKSYIQPLIVLSVVPYGIIGVVLGHLVMGYPMTIMSSIGTVALTGIVVNDSMLVVTFINRAIASGVPPMEAAIQGGTSRLRAILLTSATTVLGVAPLLLERSFQAEFLIPMGIAISAGLIFATVLTLIAVPGLYLIVLDLRSLGRASVDWIVGRVPDSVPPEATS
ncbi:MAG: efflux RND transporter permease subunit [Phycisphaerae bacterium]